MFDSQFAIVILTALFGVVIGIITGLIISSRISERKLKKTRTLTDSLIQDSKKKADVIVANSQKEAVRIEKKAKDFEREVKEKHHDLLRRESRLAKKEENIEKKGDLLSSKEMEIEKKEKTLITKERELQQRDQSLNEFSEEAKKKLEKVANMTQDEAKKVLMSQLIDEVKIESARQVKMIEEEMKEESEKKAKRILSIALSRFAGEYANENTVSIVSLPNDDMKGRIIGREGRNIRAFEAATGIDLIIDDTPEAVLLSGFNPVRREVARQSLQKLITDGRIHPSRIEEIVEKTTKEIDQTMKEIGESALFELGLTSMHPDLVKVLGSLKYRSSYAQNVLTHSIEVGFLCGIMASELGLNAKEAKRAGVLHDIGKAIDHEVEGPHAIVGSQLAKKYGESAEVVHAIASHHEEEKPQTILAHLVTAADALSGARPGARREILETYLKRLEDLESVCKEFKGVERSYVIQAGREVRVFVESEQISDEGLTVMARDISKRIEERLTYPGQIKVTVIREKRAVDYAK